MNLQSNTENVRNLILYFQVHQPKRLKSFKFFDIGIEPDCFNNDFNRDIIQRVAKTCYLPANSVLLKLIKANPNIKVCFSISGVTLDQFADYAPEVIESFKALANTGCVEFLGETYFHSLACMIPGHEFEIQVLKHAELIERLFGRRPSFFRNTELIYNNEIGKRAALLGFTGVFADGVKQVLNHDKSVFQVYQHPEETDFKILLRNYIFSDDIAFRFNQYGAKLTVEKYMAWLNEVSPLEQVINIGLDYETFGEHQKKETGVMDFLKKFLLAVSKSKTLKLATPSEVVKSVKAHSKLSVQKTVSWADQERDISAWLGNEMQKDAFESLKKLERDVKQLNDPKITRHWRLLQTSDHFYYMSTKRGSDGSVHNYFSHYPSPYEAFINYMNVLTDFTINVNSRKAKTKVIKSRKVQKRVALPQHITI
jgi:alpha-amylase